MTTCKAALLIGGPGQSSHLILECYFKKTRKIKIMLLTLQTLSIIYLKSSSEITYFSVNNLLAETNKTKIRAVQLAKTLVLVLSTNLKSDS